MTKDMVVAELAKRNISAKVVFKQRSPFMANRYKEEYITPEAWIYIGNRPSGQVITLEDWENEEYRKSFFDYL